MEIYTDAIILIAYLFFALVIFVQVILNHITKISRVKRTLRLYLYLLKITL